MSNTQMVMVLPVQGGDFLAAGEAASKIKKTLQQLGISPDLIRRVSIASYEAEMNIVIHAFHGKITLYVDEKEIRVHAEDSGKGIPDLNLAMMEGFSTASEQVREMGFGAGMGLPNIKKCTDDLQIKTEINIGTKVVMSFTLL